MGTSSSTGKQSRWQEALQAAAIWTDLHKLMERWCVCGGGGCWTPAAGDMQKLLAAASEHTCTDSWEGEGGSNLGEGAAGTSGSSRQSILLFEKCCRQLWSKQISTGGPDM